MDKRTLYGLIYRLTDWSRGSTCIYNDLLTILFDRTQVTASYIEGGYLREGH